jgi:molybdopterin/thiamine biosynthesis adenylyltransferase
MAIVVRRDATRGERRRVLVIGLGGLGCPVAELLAQTQSCELELADGDKVDRSNLPRQWLYGDADLGMQKVDAAAKRLRSAFPGVALRTSGVVQDLDPTPYALVIDCTDDVDFKFAVNDACVRARVPLISGGVIGLRGYALRVEGGPCLRCVFEAPTDEMRKSCRDAGVLGPLTSVVGAVMAAMAMRSLAAEKAEPMWSIDLLDQRARVSQWQRRDNCGVTHALT